MSQQFRNKAEAKQAIRDMEQRAERADENSATTSDAFSMRCYVADMQHYRAEAARIRALLPNLPE